MPTYIHRIKKCFGVAHMDLHKNDNDEYDDTKEVDSDRSQSGSDDIGEGRRYHLPSISTMYTRLSARLLRSAETSTTVVIAAIIALAAMSLIDTFEVESVTKIFPGDSLDLFITIVSFGVLAAMVHVLRSLLKTRKTLDRWANTFEENAIKNSLNITLSALDKNAVIQAISESVEQLAEPLERYLEASPLAASSSAEAGAKQDRSSPDEFFDVKINRIASRFDVLIDEDHVDPEKDLGGEQSLKGLLRDYGSVIVKIADGLIDGQTVRSFSDDLRSYSKTTGHSVGMALLLCRKASPEAMKAAVNAMPKQVLKNNQSQQSIIVIEVPYNRETGSEGKEVDDDDEPETTAGNKPAG